jgi:hypothetical protein
VFSKLAQKTFSPAFYREHGMTVVVWWCAVSVCGAHRHLLFELAIARAEYEVCFGVFVYVGGNGGNEKRHDPHVVGLPEEVGVGRESNRSEPASWKNGRLQRRRSARKSTQVEVGGERKKTLIAPLPMNWMQLVNDMFAERLGVISVI